MEYDDNNIIHHIPSYISIILSWFLSTFCIHHRKSLRFSEVPHSLHWIHCECGYLLPGRGGHGSGRFADAEPLGSVENG